MLRPLVSVILPVFNGKQFIVEALESIWAQDYEPLEVLVVDDGSSDHGDDLVAEIAGSQPELRLLRHDRNQGPAAARNAGLAVAAGGLITFLDADDLMTTGRLHFQVEYLASHPEVDVVVGTEAIRLGAHIEAPAWIRRHQPRFYQMSMMVRPAVFDRIGPFDESFRVSSDTEWMYRAAVARVRTALIDRDFLVRRFHGGNITYRTEDIQRATMRALLKTARSQLRRSDT